MNVANMAMITVTMRVMKMVMMMAMMVTMLVMMLGNDGGYSYGGLYLFFSREY